MSRWSPTVPFWPPSSSCSPSSGSAARRRFSPPTSGCSLREHGVHIGLFLLVVFVNLFALFYGIARLVFLKDTGVKLHHLDRQLATRDTVLADLTRRIEE